MDTKRPNSSGLLRSAGWITVTLVSLMLICGIGWGAWTLLDPLGGSREYRIEAIRTIFTAIAGAGGLITLGLFTHRAWVQHRSYRDASYDAEERRITELYVKAVDQLGSRQAAVRLGGLYALDRLGRDHIAHQREVADILCAYLRRVYIPPAHIIARSNIEDTGTGSNDRYVKGTSVDEIERERLDEYEVRMTAQRILISHLTDPRPRSKRDDTPPPTGADYWHIERIDLSGATLVDVDMRGCYLPEMLFHGTRFRGYVRFDSSRFAHTGMFLSAQFTDASFSGTRFLSAARFHHAQFNDHATFTETIFAGRAAFDTATFARGATFHGSIFDGTADFTNAALEADTSFDHCQFLGALHLTGAMIDDPRATLSGIANIDEQQLCGWPENIAVPTQRNITNTDRRSLKTDGRG